MDATSSGRNKRGKMVFLGNREAIRNEMMAVLSMLAIMKSKRGGKGMGALEVTAATGWAVGSLKPFILQCYVYCVNQVILGSLWQSRAKSMALLDVQRCEEK